MKKIDKRPVNLDFTTIKFPTPAIASFFHRLSGVILFLLLPFLLWIFSKSLTQAGYDELTQRLSSPGMKFLIWIVLASLIYHLIAGIRHLLMDAHIGEGLRSGTVAAWITLILSFSLIILTGVWLWL